MEILNPVWWVDFLACPVWLRKACWHARISMIMVSLSMLPTHRAIGLQTGCMKAMLAPWLRLPDSNM